MRKPAYGYIRVSSRGQAADDRDGLPRQKEEINKWAKANNLRIVRWFEDTVTGKKELEERPALRGLLAALHSNGTRTVVIEKLDRLARDLMIQESVIADFQRSGFTLVSVAEPDLCSTDPTRVLLRQMMGAFAQYERTMIVLKLRGARQRARAKDPSRHEGRKPFGHRTGEAETIRRMRALRAEGLGYQAIGDKLTAEGCSPRFGKQWYASAVQKILRRSHQA